MERGAGRVKRGSQGLESTPVSEMPTEKKINIWEVANFTFLALKKTSFSKYSAAN